MLLSVSWKNDTYINIVVNAFVCVQNLCSLQHKRAANISIVSLCLANVSLTVK